MQPWHNFHRFRWYGRKKILSIYVLYFIRYPAYESLLALRDESIRANTHGLIKSFSEHFLMKMLRMQLCTTPMLKTSSQSRRNSSFPLIQKNTDALLMPFLFNFCAFVPLKRSGRWAMWFLTCYQNGRNCTMVMYSYTDQVGAVRSSSLNFKSIQT